jgi:hypothetical protein
VDTDPVLFCFFFFFMAGGGQGAASGQFPSWSSAEISQILLSAVVYCTSTLISLKGELRRRPPVANITAAER